MDVHATSKVGFEYFENVLVAYEDGDVAIVKRPVVLKSCQLCRRQEPERSCVYFHAKVFVNCRWELLQLCDVLLDKPSVRKLDRLGIEHLSAGLATQIAFRKGRSINYCKSKYWALASDVG